MKKASEAREMMERAIENNVEKMIESAMEFCEDLSQEIEEKAQQKICNLIFTIPNNIRKAYVIEILIDNGYSINNRNDGRFEIMW